MVVYGTGDLSTAAIGLDIDIIDYVNGIGNCSREQ